MVDTSSTDNIAGGEPSLTRLPDLSGRKVGRRAAALSNRHGGAGSVSDHGYASNRCTNVTSPMLTSNGCGMDRYYYMVAVFD